MKHRKTLATLGVGALVAVGTLATAKNEAQGFFFEPATHFALIGDTPYAEYQIGQVDEMLREINASRSEFTVHVGDIKSGSTLCSDELIQQRYDQLQQLRSLVYTPGDNEWTDCHRKAAGLYEPLERLSHLRELFFARPTFTTGQRPFRVYPQSLDKGYEPFVENVLFVRSNVVISTLHVVGSNNNLALWDGIGETAAAPRQDRLDEVAAREAATLAWIDRTFDAAEKIGAAGVLIAMQADPAIEAEVGSALRKGFDNILAKLAERSIAFNRPVVLAHGDSHYFRVDKPLVAPTQDDSVKDAPRRLEDFTRVETFGDGEVHWVEVVIDPKTPEVFRFTARIVESNKYGR
ncbi:MAG TPA: hypothetical protein VFX59_15095 [Polyangiales bacterium]|nr:hypothetical protein [Polyangiales bacterium]